MSKRSKKKPALGSVEYYDEAIDWQIKHKPQDWYANVMRLLRARNVNAQIYGKPERDAPPAFRAEADRRWVEYMGRLVQK